MSGFYSFSTGSSGGGVTEAATLTALNAIAGSAGDVGKVTGTGLYYQYDTVLGWRPISTSVAEAIGNTNQKLGTELSESLAIGMTVDP